MKPHLPHWIRGPKKETDSNGESPLRMAVKRTALGATTTVILSVLLCLHLIPDKVSLNIGDISPTDIRAHRTVTYTDTAETDQLRNAAAFEVLKPHVGDSARAQVAGVFDAAREARSGYRPASWDAEVQHIADRPLAVLISASDSAFLASRSVAEELVSQQYGPEIRSDVTDAQRNQRIEAGARKALGSTPQASAVANIVHAVVKLNPVREADHPDMRAECMRAKRHAKDVVRQVVTGTTVIAKGEVVNSAHMDQFRALGLARPKIDYNTAGALSLFVVILVSLVTIYLKRYQPEIHASLRKLTLLSLVVVLSMVGLKLGGGMLGLDLSGLQMGYLGMMTVTTAGMLLAVLLNVQVAAIIVSLLSIASGLTMNNELRFAAVTLVSSLVGVYCVSKIRDRSDLARTIGAIAMADIAMVWTVGNMSGDSTLEMAMGSVWVIATSIVAATFFWVGTCILERPFGITTHVSLLELSDTNKPLLRRLVMEAPGTYTHSMAVGHLAEAAAEAVGADSLLARVASYYHDIGKARRPHFFVENQGVENAHDRLSPTLSALVITSHIKDGIDIAKEYRLPQVFHEIILQHHGTSLVTYFYNQIAESEDCSAVLERQFRYSGPKPQSKEAAIVMLADSVEAASRSLAKPTPARLDSLVRGVVGERVGDGQLDQSDLTFRDIGRITDSFVNTLSGTLHARIEYPDVITVDGKKLTVNGDSDSERPAAAGKPKQAQAGREKIAAN